MKNFLKVLDVRAIPLYFLFFGVLTLIGDYLNFGHFGLDFSTPITLMVLIIDLSITYEKYKKWRQN